MLESLITSKIRVKILTLFFLHTSENFYTRQIQRLIDEDYKNVQKELKHLTKFELLNANAKGNMVFYSINKKNTIYNDLKNIIYKTNGFADILKEKINKIIDIKFAFIFGSVAQGDERADSDIDLMIIGETGYDIIVKKVLEIENELNIKINLVFYKIKEFTKNLKIKKTFFVNVYEGKKIFLIGNENEFNKIGKWRTDKMRVKRHQAVYDYVGVVSEEELKYAFKLADKFIKKIKELINQKVWKKITLYTYWFKK